MIEVGGEFNGRQALEIGMNLSETSFIFFYIIPGML